MNPLIIALDFLPFIGIFAVLWWTMLFLSTLHGYSHYPHMTKKDKIRIAILNATSITVIILGIIFIALVFVINYLV